MWLDDRTIVVGRGYRTNDEGIRQLRALLADSIDELIVVPLPHWRGPGDVFHLMSILSPVDHDLAVVYSPLMPVTFHERLAARGIELVEVPDAEFDSMGANVLALSPRRALMVEGNPRTRALLERAGAEVLEYTRPRDQPQGRRRSHVPHPPARAPVVGPNFRAGHLRPAPQAAAASPPSDTDRGSKPNLSSARSSY